MKAAWHPLPAHLDLPAMPACRLMEYKRQKLSEWTKGSFSDLSGGGGGGGGVTVI